VRTTFVFVLGGVSCASSGATTDTTHEAAPHEALIVFTAGEELQGSAIELYSINEDGGDLRQLTDDGTVKTALSMSPDGSRLAYAAFGNELTEEASLPDQTSIYVVDADGSNRRVICEKCSRTAYSTRWEPTDIPYDPWVKSVPNSLAWSPDGSKIAAPAAGPEILLLDVDTAESSTISTPEPITAIAWSPDGQRLAASHTWFQPEMVVPREGTALGDRYERPPGGIYLVDVASGDIEKAISTPGMAHVHGWSPDGELIAFTQHFGTDEDNEGNEVSMYSVSQDTSWSVVAPKRWQWGLGGSWSPAGGRFAALVEQGAADNRSAEDLIIASSDGSTPGVLPLCRFEGAFDGDVCMQGMTAWSPDGTTVAYRAFITGTPIVSAVILQGVDDSSTEILRIDGPSFYITWGDNEACCLAWLPATA